ncbi:hypothetical protein LJB88_03680, partial [Erysipelotrichaceae bacterium OttesenSCG-928-M19]|nr:hypothetical protein [Erysipelotrichaceae bacterium OttesenSCG-928-M19]
MIKKLPQEYIQKVLKLNKKFLITILVAIISSCGNSISNEVFKKNNEVIKKINDIKQYNNYDFFDDDYSKNIGKIEEKISNLEGDPEDILNYLDEYL